MSSENPNDKAPIVTARFRADRVPLISLFVSTEETRYYLQGFLVERHPSGTGVLLVATDGHRMGIFHDAEGSLEGADRMIVKATKATLAACGKAPRGAKPESWQCEVTAPTATTGGTLKVGSIDLTDETKPLMVEHIQPNCLIDGTFPDWRRVIPADCSPNANAPWAYRAEQLASFGKVAATVDRGRLLTIHGNTVEGGPAIVSTGRPDFYGVLMPMRSTHHHGRPIWLEGGAPATAAKPQLVKAA